MLFQKLYSSQQGLDLISDTVSLMYKYSILGLDTGFHVFNFLLPFGSLQNQSKQTRLQVF